jgi:hypothetical protein
VAGRPLGEVERDIAAVLDALGVDVVAVQSVPATQRAAEALGVRLSREAGDAAKHRAQAVRAARNADVPAVAAGERGRAEVPRVEVAPESGFRMEAPTGFGCRVRRRSTGKVVLCIGDAHVRADDDFHRFYWLGRLIRDLRPDRVVSVGDFADMHSLSSYDRKRRSAEGARYKDDVDATNHAIDIMHREAGPALEQAERDIGLGNHEARVETFVNDNGELYGAIGYDDFDWLRRGWRRHGFLEPFDVEGFLVSHYLKKPGAPTVMAGVNHARSMLMEWHRSVMVGHSHLRQHAMAPVLVPHGAPARRIHALVLGCYEEVTPKYAMQSAAKWDRGLTVLRGVRDGDFDSQEWLDIGFIRREYGTASERAA